MAQELEVEAFLSDFIFPQGTLVQISQNIKVTEE